MLVQSTNRDLSVELFGVKQPAPVLFAPVGVQSIFHQDREVGVAEMANEIGIPYILSTAASSTIEDVAKANGPDGNRWYQLYWPHDEEVTESLLKRAKDNGYKVLVVTLDTWCLGWRPADLDNAYVPFALGVGNEVGFKDPVVRRQFKEKFGKEIEQDIQQASMFWESKVFNGKAHTWEQLEHLKKNWEGPIVLKGIQHVDDARKALECGVQGIIVSNHGGRQLDGAIGSLEVLPEIVDAVGDKMTVLFDSGIRTGADIIKALALGAKAVLVGRPFIYGLAVAGKRGARDAMKGILAVSSCWGG
jgi:lactate 2-monooxygenase